MNEKVIYKIINLNIVDFVLSEYFFLCFISFGFTYKQKVIVYLAIRSDTSKKVINIYFNHYKFI